jgi:hypothetical protein
MPKKWERIVEADDAVAVIEELVLNPFDAFSSSAGELYLLFTFSDEGVGVEVIEELLNCARLFKACIHKWCFCFYLK